MKKGYLERKEPKSLIQKDLDTLKEATNAKYCIVSLMRHHNVFIEPNVSVISHEETVETSRLSIINLYMK